MNYWLIKSEPEEYSWEQMKQDQTEPWDGVRNYQARNYMKQMKLGDLAFFYHSGKERRIMGVVKISRAYYPDEENLSFGLVDVTFVAPLPNSLTLKEIKGCDALALLPLIKQPRLSVMPIKPEEWGIMMKLSEKNKNACKS